MKKPSILVIQRDDAIPLLSLPRQWASLEVFGFHVLVCSPATSADLVPEGFSPDLIILDRPLPKETDSAAKKCGQTRLSEGPLIVLSEEKGLALPPQAERQGAEGSVDPIALIRLIEQKLTGSSRKGLRMTTRLPCVFTLKKRNHFGEILNLGLGGAFVKIANHGLRAGDQFDLEVPLFGLKKELEIRSQVVYLSPLREGEPHSGGLGVTFLLPEPQMLRDLEEFLRLCLQNETTLLGRPPRSNAPADPAPVRSTETPSAPPPRMHLLS